MTDNNNKKSFHIDELHQALCDPILDSINFLNEVIDRYPSAISFAPGAPFAALFDDMEMTHYVEAYEEYLREKGLTDRQIKKHLYQYGPSKGLINDLIARALVKDENMQVSGEDLVVTVGCQEAIILSLKALCRHADDTIAVVNPCFAGIAGAARVLGIDMVAVNEIDGSIDWSSLITQHRQLREQGKNLKALYVAPDFSNPSGTILSMLDRQRLLQVAEQLDLILLEDNAYGFTAENQQKLPTLKSLDHNDRVIYLGTCAKICMPGARIGFAVANQRVYDDCGQHQKLSDQMATLKSMFTVNTPPICQAIVGGMLIENNYSFASISEDKACLYRGNLNYLLETLESHLGNQKKLLNIDWNIPTGGFFLRLTLPIKVDLELLNKSANDYGVLWTPMQFFSLNELGKNELRLSCSFLTHEEISEGVKRLAQFIKDVCDKEIEKNVRKCELSEVDQKTAEVLAHA